MEQTIELDWTYESVDTQLREWQQEGMLSHLDRALAGFVAAPEKHPEASGLLALLVALLSYQVNRGHVCLALDDMLRAPHQSLQLEASLLQRLTTSPQARLQGVTLDQARAALKQSNAVAIINVANEGSGVNADVGSSIAQPMVMDDNNLYLTRFWCYERAIASNLHGRMQSRAFEAIDTAQLNQLLDSLFGADSENLEDSAQSMSEHQRVQATPWQKLACANTLRGRFSVITGGPGTGKTYTVVRLLALLQRLASREGGAPLTIKLAAPTGKAAARLKGSIQQALAEMSSMSALSDWTKTLAQIDSDSTTLHKLLGTQQRTRRFRHHQHNPLSLDVLVVDEASMIDIEMMHALLSALPKHAQLILLGDKDQLASVEAGAVLGQLCEGAEQGRYRHATFDFLQSVSAVPMPTQLLDANGPEYLQHVVMLRVSRRFDDASGIGHLARAVNQGDSNQVYGLLTDTMANSSYSDIELIQGNPSESRQNEADEALWSAIQRLCYQGFKGYWQVIQQRPAATDAKGDSAAAYDAWARDVLSAYADFQLLTALREGPFGVQGLNQRVATWLDYIPKRGHMEDPPSARSGQWYEGRPVMVTENDYSLNLRNGDVGVTLYSPVDNAMRVVFIDSHGQLRWILPSRLRHVETVFAMTVHKSQGSEFTHTVLVLPPHDSPVLSRELVYTGITRAAKRLTLVAADTRVLGQAVVRQTERAGRLLAAQG